VSTTDLFLEMSDVCYPERAVVKRSNQLQSHEHQYPTGNCQSLDTYALRDVNSRQIQYETQNQWFFDFVLTWFPNPLRSIHPSSLPLHCNNPVQATPVNSIVFEMTRRHREALHTKEKQVVAIKNVEFSGRQTQQGPQSAGRQSISEEESSNPVPTRDKRGGIKRF
jgi:hypothetical protein